MLTCTVLRYFPFWVKKSNFPRYLQILLRLFTEKKHILLTPCSHPKISQHSKTAIPNVTHEEKNVFLQIIHKSRKKTYKAVICVRTLQSFRVVRPLCTNLIYFWYIFLKREWSSKLLWAIFFLFTFDTSNNAVPKLFYKALISWISLFSVNVHCRKRGRKK